MASNGWRTFTGAYLCDVLMRLAEGWLQSRIDELLPAAVAE